MARARLKMAVWSSGTKGAEVLGSIPNLSFWTRQQRRVVSATLRNKPCTSFRYTCLAGRISNCISQTLGGVGQNNFIIHMQQPALHAQPRQLVFHYRRLALGWCPNSKCSIKFLPIGAPLAMGVWRVGVVSLFSSPFSSLLFSLFLLTCLFTF